MGRLTQLLQVVGEERKIFKIHDELWEISDERDFRDHVYWIDFFSRKPRKVVHESEPRAKVLEKQVDGVGKHIESVVLAN
jgi:hypothetical protein